MDIFLQQPEDMMTMSTILSTIHLSRLQELDKALVSKWPLKLKAETIEGSQTRQEVMSEQHEMWGSNSLMFQLSVTADKL